MSKKSSEKPKKNKKKKKNGLAPEPIVLLPPVARQEDIMVAPEPEGHAHPVLARVRARWEHGDWESVLDLDAAQIAADPDRAKLALILAAAHSHSGEIEQARVLARQAVAWGASRDMTARVLLSAAQNSLARVAAALEEDPLPHFETAIRLVQPHADVPLVARSRRVRELARMGLLPDAAAGLEQELGLLRAETPVFPKGTVDKLQGQLDELRKYITSYRPFHTERTSKNFTVVIAGVPRSGSTWLYNATRLLLEENGHTVYARWKAEYDPNTQDGSDFHVVKVHAPEDLSFPYDHILTTNREIIDRLASLIRMNWLKQDAQAVHAAMERNAKLYDFWNKRTDHETDFDMICKSPEKAIFRIASSLKVPCNARVAATVHEKLENLDIPEDGESPDLVTQLHPGHRSDGKKTKEIADWIRSIL